MMVGDRGFFQALKSRLVVSFLLIYMFEKQ